MVSSAFEEAGFAQSPRPVCFSSTSLVAAADEWSTFLIMKETTATGAKEAEEGLGNREE